jgi:hypothetical protein
MKLEMTMMAQRYEYLKHFYNEKRLTETRKYSDQTGEYVDFDIEVDSPFDIIEIFSAGVSYGINGINLSSK